jgi:hypothetical protein
MVYKKGFSVVRKKIIYMLCLFLFHHNCCVLQFEIKNTRQIRRGITYSIYNSSQMSLVAYVLKMSLNSIDIKLIPAFGQREETSSIAKRSHAFIAINGSNYRRGGKYNGNRVNLFYLNSQLITDLGLARGSFGWRSMTETALIDTMYTMLSLQINNQAFPIDQINQPRGSKQSALYTHVADITLLAHNQGTNIIINDQGIITEITQNLPNIIKSNWYIYQIDQNFTQIIKEGMAARFAFDIQSRKTGTSYLDYDFLFGGAGLLLQNGIIVTDNLYEEFSQGNAIVHCNDEIAADFHTKEMQKWLIEQRHPRTALGITKNNELCIAVIDGRQSTSDGLTLKELALFMHQQECLDALNIGGGGCTTLYIEGELVNKPSDQTERPVSEALCFYPKE